MSYQDRTVSRTFRPPKGYKAILTNLANPSEQGIKFRGKSFPASHQHCGNNTCSWLTHNLWVTQMLFNYVSKCQTNFPFGKLFPAYVLRKWKIWHVLYWEGVTLSVPMPCTWGLIKCGISHPTELLLPAGDFKGENSSPVTCACCYMRGDWGSGCRRLLRIYFTGVGTMNGD